MYSLFDPGSLSASALFFEDPDAPRTGFVAVVDAFFVVVVVDLSFGAALFFGAVAAVFVVVVVLFGVDLFFLVTPLYFYCFLF